MVGALAAGLVLATSAAARVTGLRMPEARPEEPAFTDAAPSGPPVPLMSPEEMDQAQGRRQLQAFLLATGRPLEWADYISNAAKENNLDAWLLAAVITVESKWDHLARGSAGEVGLMQVLPTTADLPAEALQDPATAVEAGARYLGQQVRHFGQQEGLAAYNGGPNNRTAGAAYAVRVLNKQAELERTWTGQ